MAKENYSAYSIVGNTLALICFHTSDFRVVLSTHGTFIDNLKKEKLIEEYIYFRISFIEEICSALLKGYPHKILMNAFINGIRQNIGVITFNKLNYKFLQYKEVAINDFSIDILLKNLGLEGKKILLSDRDALTKFFESDIKKYTEYTEEILKILLSEHDERPQKLKYFNENIGKDFDKAYLFLNDALENKKFDVHYSKLGVIIFFIVIIFIVAMIIGTNDSNSKNVDQSKPISVTEENENNQPEIFPK